MTKEVVLICGRDVTRDSGGGINYVAAHARAASRLGFEPHIFCISKDDGVVETAFGTAHLVGARLRRFEKLMQSDLRDLEFPLDKGLLVNRVEEFLATRQPPYLLHGFAMGACAAVAVAKRVRARGKEATAIASAFTTKVHEGEAKLRWVKTQNLRRRVYYRARLLWLKHVIDPLEGEGYCQADRLIVNYDSVRRILLQSYGRHAPLSNIPYASELAFREDAPYGGWPVPDPLARLTPGDAPLIISVSRHDPRKGLNTLVAALGQLRDLGIPFRACLVGRGVLKDHHERLVESLGLAESVVVTGPVPDPRPYLAAADIYTLPSLEEGSGSVALLEALQFGLPSVVSNIDGLPEDISDGDNGLLVPAADPIALAMGLKRLIEDRNLRARLSVAARQTFIERFSPEAMTAALGGVYAELGFDFVASPAPAHRV